jgi:hypothetical protein
MRSSSASIFMVRPSAFQFNAETAVSNDFQTNVQGLNANQILQKAQREFDNMVEELQEVGIDVTVFEDTIEPAKPDAIFPNNWISLSQEGVMTIFPMKTANRRLEIREDIIQHFRDHYEISKEIDLTYYQDSDRALEGTGSIVFDHKNRKAYACLSPRTDLEIFNNYCADISYKPMVFHSYDGGDKLIYHTNVVMCVGDGYVIIGLDTVKDDAEKEMLIHSFEQDGLQIIALSNEQVLESFAGNMLEVRNDDDEKFLVMSKLAYSSLEDNQELQLEKYVNILPVSIDIIEKIGGGSARCMMAEIFLNRK